MTVKQAVPTVGEVVGAGIEALVAARPGAAAHIESGNYGNVVEGWRAQFELARRRLVDEHCATRLPLARGQELSELTAGNYDCPRRQEPTAAIGAIVIRRAVVHYRATSNFLPVDASDGTTAETLLRAIATYGNTHIASVYSTGTGLGAHVQSNGAAMNDMGASPIMNVLVSAANVYKSTLNLHFANGNGGTGATDFRLNHHDADTASTITVPDAFASDTLTFYSAQTTASQQSLLRLANAIKAALVSHFALEARAGAVKRGTRFERRADPTAQPPFLAAVYAASADKSVRTGADFAIVPIEATTTGPDANEPAMNSNHPYTLVALDALYDDTATLKFAPTFLTAAGGADAQPDGELERAARANWAGRYGPTVGALLAGALASFGASRTVIREDATTGTAIVYAVDPSWAQSTEWLARLQQALSDPKIGFLGFGCKMTAPFSLVNQLIRAELTVVLKNAAFLTDTTDLTDRITATLRAYFDDRADWYFWRASAIRARVTKCDARILTCSQVNIFNQDSEPLTEPTVATGSIFPNSIVHYQLLDNPIAVTFVGPS